MRHGTTIWNEKGITQGCSNNRLSKTGIQKTKEVADKYKNIKFGIIYSSPLMRTIQTANIMNKFHDVKIIKDIRLIEIDQGIFTGRSKYDLTEEEKKLKFSRDKSCRMESYQSIHCRSQEFLKHIKENCKFENVLIITHNCIATSLENILCDVQVNYENDNHLRNFRNAQIKKFKY